MIAHFLIDDSIPSVQVQDSIAKMLSVMEDNLMSSLPVIDEENKYLGNIHESTLLDIIDAHQGITLFITKEDTVFQEEHFLNILKSTSLQKNNFLAIINNHGEYIGSLSIRTILQFLSQTKSIEEQGGIIILELKAINYSLTEIARIVESNHASIIHSFVSSSPQSENIFVTIKINKNDLKEIVLSFERFHFHVLEVFHSSEYENDLKDRYDSLMVYLNV
ncbi:MAG: CBS domain-containing protein [Chitinophagales bacterium]|nr:CBS domain-containing protein [Chitinophagales bacterium]MCZ2393927.1 CBS domain-containing protein [Chitinophagales bacterium]